LKGFILFILFIYFFFFHNFIRVVRESKSYDPKQVKDFLKESKLSDPQALVIVCDRFNFIDELTKYLYTRNEHKAIERYITGFNTKATPLVLTFFFLISCYL
jgi:clathrin heavy chain